VWVQGLGFRDDDFASRVLVLDLGIKNQESRIKDFKDTNNLESRDDDGEKRDEEGSS
jgi:hypothetical protein